MLGNSKKSHFAHALPTDFFTCGQKKCAEVCPKHPENDHFDVMKTHPFSGVQNFVDFSSILVIQAYLSGLPTRPFA